MTSSVWYALSLWERMKERGSVVKGKEDSRWRENDDRGKVIFPISSGLAGQETLRETLLMMNNIVKQGLPQ